MEGQGLGLAFGGEEHDEYLLSGMVWADNYWLFSDDKEKLVCMVNDIIEELLDLDMEPKLASLCWTNTEKDEDVATLKVGSRERKLGTCPSWRYSMSWAVVFVGIRRGARRLRRRFEKGLSLEKCVLEDKMPQGGQPRFQHRCQWKN